MGGTWSIYPDFEGHELQYHLHREEHGEDQVQSVGQLGDVVRLVAVLFREGKNDFT